eukprot:TRINITY_DN2652_c0_g1_i1.p1 TRINITY_DN2652_c0_g1~~TRINITY_DN2652_c0_g1_i1.p1  ORF type:complete len:323 (-),score=96.82 TRINITY_DN2652_c0_g1_i1:210-1178(-)
MGCGGSKDKERKLKEDGPEPFEDNKWRQLEAAMVVPEEQMGITAHAELHRGAFSPSSGETVQVSVKKYASEDAFEMKGLREARVLSNIHHPNLVKLVGVCNESLSVVTEHSSIGSIRAALIATPQPLTYEHAIRLATGVINGLFFLHGMTRGELIHGDVNSGTVMINGDWVPKLAHLENSHLVGLNGIAQADDVCLSYAAPEMLSKDKVLVKGSDIYSFGVLLTALFGRVEPFLDKYGTDQDAIFVGILRDEKPAMPAFCPQALVHLAESCMTRKIVDRPSAKQVKKLFEAATIKKGKDPGFRIPHPAGGAVDIEVTVDTEL